jgi:hypothetical protein
MDERILHLRIESCDKKGLEMTGVSSYITFIFTHSLSSNPSFPILNNVKNDYDLGFINLIGDPELILFSELKNDASLFNSLKLATKVWSMNMPLPCINVPDI